MNRGLSVWLLAGSILASGLAGIALCVTSLAGLPSGAGDSLAGPSGGATLAMLVAGAVVLLCLELAHLSGRRPADATAVHVAGQQSPGALRTRAAP